MELGVSFPLELYFSLLKVIILLNPYMVILEFLIEA